jgi:hypothetical protein
MSSGLRLVITPLLKTTSSSTHVPPVLRISVFVKRRGRALLVLRRLV